MILSKKEQTFGIIICLLAIIGLIFAAGYASNHDAAIQKPTHEIIPNTPLAGEFISDTITESFDIKIVNEDSAVLAAEKILNNIKTEKETKELSVKFASMHMDTDGSMIYHFNQYYRDVLVYNSCFNIYVEENGSIKKVVYTLLNSIDVFKKELFISNEKIVEIINTNLDSNYTVDDLKVTLNEKEQIIYWNYEGIRLAFVINLPKYNFFIDVYNGEVLNDPKSESLIKALD